MKKQILLLLLFVSSLVLLSQEKEKTLDIIYFKDGKTIETRIVRVTNRKMYYHDPNTMEIVETHLKNIDNYEFNDEFFQTNLMGKLVHKEVVWVDGYKKDEIYRAIKDWFQVNSRKFGSGIFLEDTAHFIIAGNVNTAEYLKLDFITVLTAMDNESDLQAYTLYYDVFVRIKNNRFKIYIMDFEISNNNTVYDKPLLRSFEKRKTKDGIVTVHGNELKKLKDMIKGQIDQIKNHCELVRLNDTYHNQIVKQALQDDDW